MKDYRKEELRYYAIGNILLILLITGVFDGFLNDESQNVIGLIGTLFGSAIIGSVVYIYVFLLDSFVPSKVKDAVAYFPTGRPGDTIFIKIREKNPDTRFTTEQAQEKYKDIYHKIDELEQQGKETKKYQNSQWYQIYMDNEKDERVATAQKDFLLMRDMSMLTIAIVVAYILFWLFGIVEFYWRVVFFIAVEFVLSNLSAKSKANRFVYNVIATDLSEKKKE